MLYTLIIMLVALLLYAVSKYFANKELPAVTNPLVEQLIQTGVRVQINFDDCEVISNNYYEEEDRMYPDRVQGMNVLSGDEMSNVEIKKRLNHQVLYKTIVHGREMTFVSPIINMEKDLLLWKLAGKKTTWLYYDRENPRTCYIDFEFLEK